jgi:hypothetical protein
MYIKLVYSASYAMQLSVNQFMFFFPLQTTFVSIGLRTAELWYSNQNKTAWKSEVVQTLGWPLPICVQTFPCVNESFWLAYTNNWGLFGKENYLIFDWWKHFLKILRRSEVTINLTRRLKKMEACEFAPL